MKITIADKSVAWLTLFSGLSISAVAVWYSVAGLVSIFAASPVPIIVMGVALEVSKLIATVWLKLNWERAPTFIKGYLLAAIAILMVITSMGIFGYLSKAHSDQSLVSGDVQSKIAVYDEKIKVAKDNIDANRKALKQMDEAVDQVMGRSQDEKGADKAVALRRGQAKERTRLLSEIAAEQKTISQLSEERAPIAAEVRKVEAEVGPIKYIASFIYGSNPDANVLEKAVTWVIIIIVSVFDPLAVILLLASQYSFMWFRKQEEEDQYLLHDTVPHDSWVADVGEKPTAEELKDDLFPTYEEITPKSEPMEGDSPEKESDIVSTATVTESEVVKEEKIADKHPYLNQPFTHFTNLRPMVAQIDDVKQELLEEKETHDFLEDVVSTTEELGEDKSAKQQWKAEHPTDTIKHQERLYELGLIEQLPWDVVEKLDEQVADNTYKILPELQTELDKQTPVPDLPERPGDYLTDSDPKKKSSYMIKEQDQQIKKTKE